MQEEEKKDTEDTSQKAPGTLPPSPALLISKDVSGTVVSGPPLTVTKVGRKYFVPLLLKGKPILDKDGKETGKHERGGMLTLSEAEFEVLRSFTQSWSYEATALETGMTEESVKRYLRHDNIKAYIDELMHRYAVRLDTTIPWAFSELRDVWEGRKDATQAQMDAMKTITKILTPKTPAVHITAGKAGQAPGQGTGPYESIMAGDIDGAWGDRKTATDGAL